MVWRYGDEESRTVAYRRPSEKRQSKTLPSNHSPLIQPTRHRTPIPKQKQQSHHGAQSRKIHTEPEWAWSLTDQADKLGIPVFMKEDLVPIIGDENMIQEMPEEFNKVLEVQKSWKK